MSRKSSPMVIPQLAVNKILGKRYPFRFSIRLTCANPTATFTVHFAPSHVGGAETHKLFGLDNALLFFWNRCAP